MDSTFVDQQLNTFTSEIKQKAQTMAELTIRPEEIREALDRFVRSYAPETASREEVGTVVTSGDGIARVEGLPSAFAGRPATATEHHDPVQQQRGLSHAWPA